MGSVPLAVLIVFLHVAHATLPFLYGNTLDSVVPRGDDTVAKITLPSTKPLAILQQKYQTLYVDTNGAIWLNWHCTTCDVPAEFPVELNKQLIACYWADADTNLNNGQVFYRLSDTNDDWTRAITVLQKWHPEAKIDPTSAQRLLLISTWWNVTFAGAKVQHTNTFQCAVVSDGTNGYVLFGFDQLTWTAGFWEGGNPNSGLCSNSSCNAAAVGIDTGAEVAIQNFTLPGSLTDTVLSLSLQTNIPKFGLLGAEQAGWHVLPDKLSTLQTKQFTLPPDVQYKTCQVSLDPHYYTFDGVHLMPDAGTPGVIPGQSFWAQPAGTYTMAATTNCKSNLNYVPFVVFANVDAQPGSPMPPSYTAVQTASVWFYFGTIGIGAPESPLVITILQGKFTVNGDEYAPPNDNWNCPAKLCSNPGKNIAYTVSVKNVGGTCYEVTTNFGFDLKVCTTPNNQFSLTLPDIDALSNNLIGYCGNMNGDTNDEERCPKPGEVNTNDLYWKCWTFDFLHDNFENPDAPGLFQCPNYNGVMLKTKHLSYAQSNEAVLSYNALKTMGENLCATLMDAGGPFKDCQSDPKRSFIYNNCVGDMTATNGDHDIRCFHFSQLAQSCMALNANTVVDWRAATGCDATCPSNSHYEAKAAGCQATCGDPLGSQMCGQLPTEGCVCDSGYLLSDQQCVLPVDCAYCIDDVGGMRKAGDSWRVSDCSRTCTCQSNGTTSCSTSTACSTNAHCVSAGLLSQCVCNEGYFGDGVFCGSTNNCQTDTCYNNGTCVSQQRGYLCQCATGYTDQKCQTLIEYCTSAPCQHGGTCTNKVGGYTCTCAPQYTGQSCEIQINQCLLYPCQNSGTCNALLGGYTCSCGGGFHGLNCEFEGSTISPTTKHATTLPPATVNSPTPTSSSPSSLRQSTLVSAIPASIYLFYLFTVYSAK